MPALLLSIVAMGSALPLVSGAGMAFTLNVIVSVLLWPH